MRKLTLVILSMILVLTMSLPAMAKGAQKSSFEYATFYGMEGSTEIYVSVTTDYENQDQYILYVDKYNYETDEIISGYVRIPKSEIVFKTNKGTVKVNTIVPLNKVEWVYDEASDSYYTIETYIGDESVNLTWSFDPKNYSSHKYVDKNIQIGPNEYIKLEKYTYKQYRGVTVSGNIGHLEIVDFAYSNASVLTGTSLQIIKNK
jgi:hypothetical protein